MSERPRTMTAAEEERCRRVAPNCQFLAELDAERAAHDSSEHQAYLAIEQERELSDQVVDVLRRTEGALYECGCESCEATLQKLCAVLTQYAAMRAKPE